MNSPQRHARHYASMVESIALLVEDSKYISVISSRHTTVVEFALAQPFSLILIDWIAIGLFVFILGGLLLAFFLYFHTAFKAGGWKNVKRSAWIALSALALFTIERIIQNREIDSLKQFVGRIF